MGSREVVVVVSPILKAPSAGGWREGGKLLANSNSPTQMAISLSEERPPVYCSSQTRLHKLNSLKVQLPERSMNFSHGHPTQLALLCWRVLQQGGKSALCLNIREVASAAAAQRG